MMLRANNSLYDHILSTSGLSSLPILKQTQSMLFDFIDWIGCSIFWLCDIQCIAHHTRDFVRLRGDGLGNRYSSQSISYLHISRSRDL